MIIIHHHHYIIQADIERHLRSIIEELRRASSGGRADGIGREVRHEEEDDSSLRKRDRNERRPMPSSNPGGASSDGRSKPKGEKGTGGGGGATHPRDERDSAISGALNGALNDAHDEVRRLREQLDAKDQALRCAPVPSGA